MHWSLKKLDAFYNTTCGVKVKQHIKKYITDYLHQYHQTEKILMCGYDIMDIEFEYIQHPLPNGKKYNCIIACHCDEVSFCFKEFSEFCAQSLEKGGFCILITPRGRGYWSLSSTPFAKYRAYKNIKALKRLNFKILKKTPILFCPFSAFNHTYHNILNFLFKLIKPTKSGALIIVAQH